MRGTSQSSRFAQLGCHQEDLAKRRSAEQPRTAPPAHRTDDEAQRRDYSGGIYGQTFFLFFSILDEIHKN
jgi:hypothetical protein